MQQTQLQGTAHWASGDAKAAELQSQKTSAVTNMSVTAPQTVNALFHAPI
jgi:hypothetical protein